MQVSSIVLLGNEKALQRQMDVTANNVANMNSTGFKRETPIFRETVRDMAGTSLKAPGAERVAYVLDYGTTHDTTQGGFKATGNPFDVAISGAGYFQVRRPDGTTAYTRNGHFEADAQGQLVSGQGLPVMSPDGQPIVLGEQGLSRLSVTSSGAVVGELGEVGRIGVFLPASEAELQQVGDALFVGPAAPAIPFEQVTIKVGGLESSNVNAVAESAEMVEIMRSYQSSKRMSEGISDLSRRTIERLARQF